MPTPTHPLPAPGVKVAGPTPQPPTPIKALDTFANPSMNASALKADGYRAIGLYYFKQSGFKSLLTPFVAKVVSGVGLKLFSVYENGNPTSAAYFNSATGNMDAHVAHVRATDAGQPAGTPIFYAVDYDAAPGDLPAIKAYFTEVKRVFGVLGDTHPIGVYSSGLVCKTLKAPGLVAFTWISQSRGFSGYADWAAHADIVQGPVQQIHGMDCDADTIINPAVLWSV